MTRLIIAKKSCNIPHMEYFFDEITEKLTIRCPSTKNLVYVEAVRRAHSEHTPFVDIVYCEGCGNVIQEEEEHLNRINKICYHH
jgi:hypothetical protein